MVINTRIENEKSQLNRNFIVCFSIRVTNAINKHWMTANKDGMFHFENFQKKKNSFIFHWMNTYVWPWILLWIISISIGIHWIKCIYECIFGKHFSFTWKMNGITWILYRLNKCVNHSQILNLFYFIASLHLIHHPFSFSMIFQHKKINKQNIQILLLYRTKKKLKKINNQNPHLFW